MAWRQGWAGSSFLGRLVWGREELRVGMGAQVDETEEKGSAPTPAAPEEAQRIRAEALRRLPPSLTRGPGVEPGWSRGAGRTTRL